MRGLANRRVRPKPTPFDVPYDDNVIGVRHDDGTLLTVLAVHGSTPGPRPLAEPWRPAAGSKLSVAGGLPWDTLTAWSRRPEALATEISVLTHGRSTGDDGPAARAYRSLLGPLSVAGERAVHLVVRFAPLAHPEWVARYGTGRSAALRAVLAATRTMTALLRADGLTVTGRTAAELTALTGKIPPVASAVIHSAVSQSAVIHYSVHPDDPAHLPTALESVWQHGAAASTALVWRTGPAGPVIRASACIDRSLDGQLRDDLPPGWRPRPSDAANADRATLPRSTATALAGTVIPVTGAGIVVGADPTGRPVTVRLAGPDVAIAEVTGGLPTAQRVVVRLAALGISSAIFTDRPERWDGVLHGVRDRHLVHPAASGAADVLIDDRPDGQLGPLARHTVIRVREQGHPVPGIPGLYPDPEDPANILISGARTPLRVRLVSTPAEDALLSPRNAPTD
ncbi:MAG: type VII secretion protein EccE [Gordonia sp. (in: high G+C Gram-positive bacteria)]|uniref:type VII secretion protein EccE n=1 Tax=Gordonia sp. (in: high G+C Gram-positive bacteria) TaxID=84139 RepID=UPI003BB59AA3